MKQKSKNSNLATLLKVQEDEVWKYSHSSELAPSIYRIHKGVREVMVSNRWIKCAEEHSLIQIINNSEKIIRAPFLSKQEFNLCKSLGAEYVSRNNNETSIVNLYSSNPNYFDQLNSYIGFVSHSILPSVKKGECICLEDVNIV